MEFDHDNDKITPDSGSLVVGGSGGLALPTGSTASRPTDNGSIRLNTETNKFEGLIGTTWSSFLTASGSGYSGQMAYGSVPQMTGSTLIPYDNTAPTSNEGTQVWTTTLYPMSTNSKFEINFNSFVDAGNSTRRVTIALFRGNALVTFRSSYCGSNAVAPITLYHIDTPNAISMVTYSIRIGVNSGTWYLGRGQSATFGGGDAGFWSVREMI